MKGKKKITLFTLIVMFVLTCAFGLVACTKNGDGTVSAKEAIERYLLPENGTLVSADFTLPKKIGKDDAITVTWKSDNENAIKVVDATDKYTAQVTLQAQITDVKLTISAEGNSKDFTVRVDELTPFTFMQKYSFKQEGTAVNADFELETKTEFQGHEATITWSVEDEASQAFLEVKEEGGKKMLHIKALPEDLTSVELHGVFTFNKKTAFKDYSFSLSPKLEHRQQVNRFYSITDYPLELSGYITHVVEASESYGNATFYMIDDDFCSGYYCYRVTIDKADVAKYKEGAHVTVTGDRTKNYNGLWENNSGGKATVDNKPAIDPREKVYALDTDLLAGAPSMLWHESTFVSLTGWKVSAKAEKKPTKGTTGTLFTLKKGDAEIAVAYTKYATYKDNADVALIDLYDTIKVDDVVSVTGLLGCYNTANGGAFDPNKFQIQPLSAADITKVETESTNGNGAKIKAALAEVEKELAAQKLNVLIASDKTVTMPTTKDGVTISYRLAGYEHLTTPTVTIGTKGAIDGGNFVIKPNDTNHNYDIEVTYKIGDYEAYSFFKLRNWKRTGAQLVELVKESINSTKLEKITEAGDVALPVDSNYGTTVTWKVKEPTTVPEWATIKDGHTLSIAYLPVEETKLTLEATITLGSDSSTVELKVTVPATPKVTFESIEAPKAGSYLFSTMHLGVRLYASSLELDGSDKVSGYITTTDDSAKAVKFTVEQKKDSTTEWYIKMGAKYLEINPYENKGKTSYSLKLVDTPTAVWTWFEAAKCFQQAAKQVVEDNPKTNNFYIGMRDDSTFTTMSPSDVYYITGDNASKVDVTQHPSRFGTMEEGTDEDWANELLGKITLETTAFTAPATVTLPTTKQYNATVTWTVKTPNETYFSLAGGKLTIKAVPASGEQKVTLHVAVTVGSGTTAATVGKDVEVTVKAIVLTGAGTAESPFTVADVVAIAGTLSGNGSYYNGDGTTPKKIWVAGYVTDPGTLSMKDDSSDSYGLKNILIADQGGTDTVKLSSVNWNTVVSKQTTNPLKVGDYLVVYGYIELFNGGATIYHNNQSTKDYPAFVVWTHAQATLTAENLLGWSGSNVAYGNSPEAGKQVNGVTYKWTELGAYGAGIQCRKKDGNTSCLWNTTAFEENITKVVLNYNAAKDSINKESKVKVEFAETADFTNAQTVELDWNGGHKVLEATPTGGGSYKFVRITYVGPNNSWYLSSIQIV